MKRICLLGATGSIGSQVIDVVNGLEDVKIVAVSCNKNFEKLSELVNINDMEMVCLGEKNSLTQNYPNTNFVYGEEGLKQIVNSNVDIVINALVGVCGLTSTVNAILAKKDILLANKESLVLAGDLINKLVKENGVKLFPIDSEHSAILQCLDGRRNADVSELIITASGGALRDLERKDLRGVTIDKVLAHPTWNMGGKITVDCSTMVNKGFEVIEAHHLFGFDYDQIKTVLHKESAVHGAIRFNDGATICQMGPTDMRLPIQYAITYPTRLYVNVNNDFDITKTFDLHFKEMDFKRYPMLALAYKVGRLGGIMPAVYCAANDAAVGKFLNGEIEFLDIERIILDEVTIHMKKNIVNPTLDDILNIVNEINMKYL